MGMFAEEATKARQSSFLSLCMVKSDEGKTAAPSIDHGRRGVPGRVRGTSILRWRRDPGTNLVSGLLCSVLRSVSHAARVEPIRQKKRLEGLAIEIGCGNVR
jgi:hypothetical protein